MFFKKCLSYLDVDAAVVDPVVAPVDDPVDDPVEGPVVTPVVEPVEDPVENIDELDDDMGTIVVDRLLLLDVKDCKELVVASAVDDRLLPLDRMEWDELGVSSAVEDRLLLLDMNDWDELRLLSVEGAEELLLLNVKYPELEVLKEVASSTGLVVEGGCEEERVAASDDELGLEVDAAVWVMELEVEENVSDVWMELLEAELVYEEESASVVWVRRLVVGSVEDAGASDVCSGGVVVGLESVVVI